MVVFGEDFGSPVRLLREGLGLGPASTSGGTTGSDLGLTSRASIQKGDGESKSEVGRGGFLPKFQLILKRI